MAKLHYQPKDSQIKVRTCWKCGIELKSLPHGGTEDTIHMTCNEQVWKNPPDGFECCNGGK